MLLYGKNVIKEILNTGKRKIYEMYTVKEGADAGDILKKAREKGIKIKVVDRKELKRITGTEKNQGIAANAEGIKSVTIDEFLKNHENKGKISVVVLDEVVDPHNVGAVIRSCEIFGVCGIILPQKKAAPISDTVYKTSSGAVEYIDVVKVVNINNTLERLKKAGFWIYGFDTGAEKYLDETEFDKKSVLVFGSEGKGMKQLVKKNCDFLVKIRQKGKLDSLNVSNAAAVVLYEVMRQFDR